MRGKNEFDDCYEGCSESERTLTPTNPTEKKPAYLWVADNPGLIRNPRQVPIETLEQELGFIFSESLWVPLCFVNKTKVRRNSSSPHDFTVDYDSFLLIKMGDLGYGLASRKEIKKGSFLFNYAGEYSSSTRPPKRNGDYAIGIRDSLIGYDRDNKWMTMDYEYMLCLDLRFPGIVDAAEYRNLSAFAQQGPDSTGQYYFSNSSIEISVATTNIQFTEKLTDDQARQTGRSLEPSPGVRTSAQDNGFTCNAVVVSETIPAYTLMTIDYGDAYWTSRKVKPELFDKQGNTISYSNYCPKELEPHFIKNMQRGRPGKLSLEILPEELIESYGNSRLEEHFRCFLTLRPKASILAYRSQRFFNKNPSIKPYYCNQGELVQPPAALVERLTHFGFIFKSYSVDLESSDPKQPKNLIA